MLLRGVALDGCVAELLDKPSPKPLETGADGVMAFSLLSAPEVLLVLLTDASLSEDARVEA